MTNSQAGEETQESLPLGLSEDAKRNAQIVTCTVTKAGDFRRNYAVCQHLIVGVEKGTINETLYGDCAAVIHKSPGMCVAHRMREQEHKQGRTIYFVDRVKDAIPEEADSERSLPKKGWPMRLADGIADHFRPRDRSKDEPKRKSSVNDKIDTGGYADAINASVKSGEHKPAVKIEPKPGESLLEMAKRLLAEKKEK